MKKYLFNIFLVLFFISVSTTSCKKDFLEEEVLTNVSVDAIYTTLDGLEGGVIALYNLMRDYNVPETFNDGSGLTSNFFFMVAHDLGHTRTYHRPYDNHTPIAFSSYKWIRGYQIIDRANAIINNAESLEIDPTKESDFKKAIAQARIIRAELYFDLIRMYDNILLDVTATTPENWQDEITYAPANPADVYALIDSDLDYAIENLTYSEPYGRYNKSTARHLKGKSSMWQENWQEAADQFDAIINESGRSLVDINDVFGQNLDHSEMMFVYDFEETLGGEGNNNLAGGGGHVFGAFLTARLYENSSGDFIQGDGEYGGQALGWSAPNEYLRSLYGDITIPDPAAPWYKVVNTNDLRYTAYYYPETFIANNPASPNFGQEITGAGYDDNVRRYNFSIKKFFDADKVPTSNFSWKDYPIYRLAETYLLGSEAHWRLGNTGTALDYINTVRRRAHGGDTSFDFASYDLDTYLEESARELAMERNRWFLLKRLGLLVERQNLHYTYGSTNGNTVLEPMAPHMIACPIPQSQIDLMGTFPQNPGY